MAPICFFCAETLADPPSLKEGYCAGCSLDLDLLPAATRELELDRMRKTTGVKR